MSELLATGVNTFVLGDLVELCTARETGVACDHLVGTGVEGGAHDGAFGGLLCELGERGVARRCDGAERAQSRCLCAAQVGTRRLEFCEIG